jgi:hypothetical protein
MIGVMTTRGQTYSARKRQPEKFLRLKLRAFNSLDDVSRRVLGEPTSSEGSSASERGLREPQDIRRDVTVEDVSRNGRDDQGSRSGTSGSGRDLRRNSGHRVPLSSGGEMRRR